MDRVRPDVIDSDHLRRPLSRRGMLRGLAALMAAGAVAPLAAACAQQPASPKPTEPAAAKTDSKPAQAVQPAADHGGRQDGPDGRGGQPAQAAKPAADSPRQGGTLKMAIIGEPPALDPTFTTATVTLNVTWHVFETLYARNEKQEPVPFLLEKADVSGDGKQWTFALRKNVLFHNDKEMTSADVVASLKRWMAVSGRGKFIAKRLESIDARDKYGVAMTFREPTGLLPTFLSMRDPIIIPEELATKFSTDRLTEYVGTGPYKHLEHLPDRHVRYGRWEKYAPLDAPTDGAAGRRVAHIEELLFIPTPEDSVRADGVGTGDFHFAENLQPDQYDTIRAAPSVTPMIVKPNFWYVPHFNKKEGIFRDVRLRQAVLLSTAMDPVMRSGWGRSDFYRLGPEIAAPETSWYNDEGKDVYDKPDPERAKALLREAGYDGTPVRWMATKEYFYMYNMSLPFKQAMEQVGFKVDLQVMDWATLVKRRAQASEYDVFITGHASYEHPALQVYLDESWPGFWASEEKDRVVNAILSEPEPRKQNELIRQLQALQWREVPCIKCGEGFGLRARRNEVRGYDHPPDWFFWNAWLG